MLVSYEYGIEASRTIAVNTLVAGQLFYLFNCRTMHGPALQGGFFRNRTIFWATVILIGLQLLFTYTPYMNLWFGTISLKCSYWIYPIASGMLVFLFVELEKYLFGRRRKTTAVAHSQ